MKQLKTLLLAVVISPIVVVALAIVIWCVGLMVSCNKVNNDVSNTPIGIREMIDLAGGPHEVLLACRQLQCQMESNGVTHILFSVPNVDCDDSPQSKVEIPTVLKQMPLRYIGNDEYNMIVGLKGPPRRLYFLVFKEGAPEWGAQKIIDGLWITKNPPREKEESEKKREKDRKTSL